jgi:hypothetical protein
MKRVKGRWELEDIKLYEVEVVYNSYRLSFKHIKNGTGHFFAFA